MSTYNDYMTCAMRYAKKYSRIALRYFIVLLVWTIRELVILLSYLCQALKLIKKYAVKYSILAWNWIKWFSPIAWEWTKVASAVAWRYTCIVLAFAWHWIKIGVAKLIRLMLVAFWHFDKWSRAKHEQYQEFKRTKGLKGLAKEVGMGMKSSFKQYMDEDQLPSVEPVLSDAEFLEEEMDGQSVFKIGKRFDNFVKKIVNEN